MSLNNPKSLYDKILSAEKASTIQELIDRENSKQIRVHMPCKVIAINGTTVDVEIQGKEDTGYGSYSSFPILLDLPIIYNNYTSSAYIITPVQVGDTGIVEFLDFNATNFNNDGNTELTSDNYYHSINNGSFINGFIPSNKQIDIPEGKPIIIGLQNNTFTFTVNANGELNINASKINIIANNVDISSNVTIDGKNFLQHTHSNGNEGNPTGGVI